MLKTMRPVRTVRTIEDVRAIESVPYDDLVTAHNLYDLFRATAAHVGERAALTVLRPGSPSDVGISLTHRELLREITRCANLFHSLNGDQGGVVAFLVPTLPMVPCALLGAQVAGVASALNYLLTREAVVDLLNIQQARVLVIPAPGLDEDCWLKSADIRRDVPSLKHVLVIGADSHPGDDNLDFDALLSGCDGDRLAFDTLAGRDTVCALFHTGGTTGRPKVVQLTHGNQIHGAFGFTQVLGYDELDSVINGFPFFHVGGTITAGLAVWAAGGHVIVPSPYALRRAAVIDGYWGLVERFKATVVSGVPTSIAALGNSFRTDNDASSVRMALTGGAVLPKAVGSRFETVTGIRLFETYGMTEVAAAIAFNPGLGTPVAGSVGFRAPFSETRIVALDQDHPRICGPNESGVVQVRGPQVFPGYADKAHNVGTLAADGWLTTGDIGYLTDDERLVLTGREKDLIVRSGHNIDPAAIEDVANQFDGVQISAAVGMPDQYAGEVPALFVVPRPGVVLDVTAIETYVNSTVHEPPARPKSVMIIDALPVTAVGKIFKPALRDLAIKEKVRLEVLRTCGADASARVDVSLDDRKNTVVRVRLSGTDEEGAAKLTEALRSLPQSYEVELNRRTASSEPVILSIDEGIATITINRPDKLNAMDGTVMSSLDGHLRTLHGRPGIRAVIITGTGRSFSAGGDLIEFGARLNEDPDRLLRDLEFNQGVLTRIEELAVPVIGVANGTAVAGGLELLLCCDLVLAAEGTKIGDGHARYGVVPAGGATVRLPRKIGPARAARLFFTADLVEVELLQSWGLVDEVVPAENLLSRAYDLAERISRCSPEAIRWIKRLTAASDKAQDVRLRAELQAFSSHIGGNDLSEGLRAFREKRPPAYGSD
ncbi:AMP-binding protein [Mesorhizobium sp. KR9-304]|uniref:AMP-binding protein n=1 Tax=Mesorhizobium sp. KR9-304 TaxID=3156614 RepID=UPI0032B60407